MTREKTDLQIAQEIAELMEKSIKLNFTEQGRPSPWAELKNPIVSHPILFSTGGLYGSIDSSARPGVAEAWAKATVHQEGSTHAVPVTEKSRGFFWMMFYRTGDEMWKWMALTKRMVFIIRIPGRKYVMFQEEDFEKIMEIVQTGVIIFRDPEGSATINLGGKQ